MYGPKYGMVFGRFGQKYMDVTDVGQFSPSNIDFFSLKKLSCKAPDHVLPNESIYWSQDCIEEGYYSHRGQKIFPLPRVSLIPFTRANAQWVIQGFN